MTAIVLLASVAILNSADQDHAMSLDDVVRANQAAIDGIRTLKIHVKEYQPDPKIRSSQIILATDYIYTFRDNEQRTTETNYLIPVTKSGDHLGIRDTYNGPTVLKSIVGYDPQNPPKLGETSYSRAQGEIGPSRTNETGLGMNTKGRLLIEALYAFHTWPLKDLVKSSTSARIFATPSTSSRKCYELSIQRKDPELDLLISVDPSWNFMIRREDMSVKISKLHTIKVAIEADRYQDCGDGVFIPLEVRTETTERGKTHKSYITNEIIICNKDLPSDAFEIKFPDWLTVVDDKGMVYIWGENDKPRKTFDSVDKYMQWYIPRHPDPSRALYKKDWSNSSWSIVIFNVVVVALITSIVIYRRRRMRQKI